MRKYDLGRRNGMGQKTASAKDDTALKFSHKNDCMDNKNNCGSEMGRIEILSEEARESAEPLTRS